MEQWRLGLGESLGTVIQMEAREYSWGAHAFNSLFLDCGAYVRGEGRQCIWEGVILNRQFQSWKINFEMSNNIRGDLWVVY